MNRSLRVFAFVFFGVAVGCVVIPNTFEANINVTIGHIEEQANDFWDEVEGIETEPEAVSEEKEVSYLNEMIGFISPIQTVHAQGTETSPRLEQIKAKIKQRYPNIQKIKKTGAVGESNRGMLELVKPEKIPNDAENGDRKALYKEIARLNDDQNMSVTIVEEIHSAALRARANTGELIQIPKEGDEFEKFKDTTLGKKIGSSAKAEAWVAVP